MKRQRKFFGYTNVCFYVNSPKGTTRYFSTRAARDKSLAALRAHAVERGLSRDAAISGIYPVEEWRGKLSGTIIADTDEWIGLD